MKDIRSTFYQDRSYQTEYVLIRMIRKCKYSTYLYVSIRSKINQSRLEIDKTKTKKQINTREINANPTIETILLRSKGRVRLSRARHSFTITYDLLKFVQLLLSSLGQIIQTILNWRYYSCHEKEDTGHAHRYVVNFEKVH